MKELAIIVNYSWAGVSPPLINSISLIIDRGYKIYLYLDRPDLKRFPIPKFISDNKQVSIIILRGLGRGLIGDIYFLIFSMWWKKKYEIVIAFDFQAILRGAIINWHSQGKLIYHNLELLTGSDIQSRIFKARERFAVKFTKYIITQDTIRALWLSKNLNQPIEKFKIVCNSSRGNSEKYSQSNYFRKKYHISDSVQIILAIGSLIREHLVLDIVNSAIQWDESKVLILHGWFTDTQLHKEVLNIQNKNPGKFFISYEIFHDNEKYIPIASCDIGFVGYLHSSLNHKLAGGASGKLFDFIKLGKPILAFNTPGIVQIIENGNFGRVFESNDEIEKNINILVNNYKWYSDNCLLNYSNYEFDRVYEDFWKTL